MKILPRSLFAVCLLAFGCSAALVRAEESAPKKEHHAEKDGPGGPRGDRAAAMKEHLGLSDAQVEKLKPLFKEQGDAMKALRDKDLEPKERQAEAKKLRESFDAKIRAVLTAEQQAKFDEMRAKNQERMKERQEKREEKRGDRDERREERREKKGDKKNVD